jgi:hypothetical protein
MQRSWRGSADKTAVRHYDQYFRTIHPWFPATRRKGLLLNGFVLGPEGPAACDRGETPQLRRAIAAAVQLASTGLDCTDEPVALRTQVNRS